jgi:hypothetical protein
MEMLMWLLENLREMIVLFLHLTLFTRARIVDDEGKIRWGTEKQIAKWQKEKNAKTRK